MENQPYCTFPGISASILGNHGNGAMEIWRILALPTPWAQADDPYDNSIPGQRYLSLGLS